MSAPETKAGLPMDNFNEATLCLELALGVLDTATAYIEATGDEGVQVAARTDHAGMVHSSIGAAVRLIRDSQDRLCRVPPGALQS